MRIASPITVTRDCPTGTEQVTLVDLRDVAELDGHYNAALVAPPHLKQPAINFARSMAALRLAEWGAAS